jgi:hypothetical protein
VAGTSLGVPTGADREVLRVGDWLYGRRVQLTGFLMVAGQVGWMGIFLSRAFFKEDDFTLYERALSNGMTWKYLMWVNGGHVTPVGLAITWVLVRIAPLSWPAAAAATLILLACADLALFRLLRTLFGDHPGILLALLAFLISPLNFPGLTWWSVASEVLPLEIAMFCALNAHVWYIRTGRFRHAAVAALWILIGVLSALKGAGVPFLLLAVTSAWLLRGKWLTALQRTLRWHWRAWALYLAVLVGYAAVYLHQVSQARQPTAFSALGGFAVFARRLIFSTFVPGVFGGPWVWFTGAPYRSSSPGQYGIANPPPGLVVIGLLVAAAIIVFTVARRRRSWRSWVIVLGWLIVIDAIPELIGRGADLPAALLGQETRYVMDGLGVLVVCAALCFLPLVRPTLSPPEARGAIARTPRERPPASGHAAAPRVASLPGTGALAIGLTVAIVVGSLMSYHNYVANTSAQQARSYFATARAALQAAPASTVILNFDAPAYATDGFYGPVALDSSLFGSLHRKDGTEPPFVNRPNGTYDRLLMFNGWGQLVPVAVTGAVSPPLPAGIQCFPWPRNGSLTVPLGSFAPGAGVSQLRFGYLGWTFGRVTVSYAGRAYVFNISRGLHSGFLPVSGVAQTVTFTGMGKKGLCVGDVQVGVPTPSTLGTPIPLLAKPG